MDAASDRPAESEAERCRRKARRCKELAGDAHLAGVRDVLLQMAQELEERASQAERTVPNA